MTGPYRSFHTLTPDRQSRPANSARARATAALTFSAFVNQDGATG